jgi:hypothetical protein
LESTLQGAEIPFFEENMMQPFPFFYEELFDDRFYFEEFDQL